MIQSMDPNHMIPGLTSPRFARRRTPDLPSYTQSASSLDLYNDPFGGPSNTNFISSSNRRMVPRDEFELSRPAIARAEKDGDHDPGSSSSARRRPMPERSSTATPTRLTRLFGGSNDLTSPGPSRSMSMQKTGPVKAAAVRGKLSGLVMHLCIHVSITFQSIETSIFEF